MKMNTLLAGFALLLLVLIISCRPKKPAESLSVVLPDNSLYAEEGASPRIHAI
jgi:hypothetical protein